MFRGRRAAFLALTLPALLIVLTQWPEEARGDSAQQAVEVRIGRATVVRGTRTTVTTTTQGDKVVQRFLGIRYAKAPVGARRFQQPAAAELPAEVDATRYGARCPQAPLTETGMSEDCLFLNVFVPERRHSVDQPLPVLVFIHGGGFVTGSADIYEGEELAAASRAVVVTLNYRLGPLGFLATGDDASRGNYGLWDQRLALQWVRKYVEHFSGDKNLVTLAGLSAGSVSASLLSLSPLSRDLFRHVVLFSGVAHNPWARASPAEALRSAKRLGQRAGCGSDKHKTSTRALVACLRQLSVDQLVQPSAVLYPGYVALSLVAYTWLPVRDGSMVADLDTAAAFSGPALVGQTNNEAGMLDFFTIPRVTPFIPDAGQLLTQRPFYKRQFLPTLLKQELPDLVPQAYPARDDPPGAEARYTRPPFSAALDSLECAYYKEGEGESTGDTGGTEELFEAFGDQAFLVGTVRYLRKFSANQPSFFYYFDYQTSRPGIVGMRHVDDLIYLFGFNTTIAKFCGFDTMVPNDVDLQIQDDFRRVFTNFLRTGDPNKPDRPSHWPVWPPYTPKGGDYLRISPEPRVLSHLRADKVALWTEELPAILTSSANASALHRQCLTSGAAASGSRHWSWRPVGFSQGRFLQMAGIVLTVCVTVVAPW